MFERTVGLRQALECFDGERREPGDGLRQRLGCDGTTSIGLPRPVEAFEQVVHESTALDRREPGVILAFLGQGEHALREVLEWAIDIAVHAAHPVGFGRSWGHGPRVTWVAERWPLPTEDEPRARSGVKTAGKLRVGRENLVHEGQAPAQGLGHGTRQPACQFNHGRGRHERVTLELESVQRGRGRGQAEQVAEGGLLVPAVVGVLRPAQRAQQAAAVEHAAAKPLGPVGLDQTHEVDVRELAEARGHRIDQVHALVTAARRERLSLDGMVNGCRERILVPVAVTVSGVGCRQAVERTEHGGPRAQVALAQPIVRWDRTLVSPQEQRDGAHLHRGRRSLAKGGEPIGDLGGSPRSPFRSGSVRPTAVPAAARESPDFLFVGTGVAGGAPASQRRVERRHRRRLERLTVDHEVDERGAQQGDRRFARPARSREGEYEVEQRRVGFARERQRVKGLIRNTRVGEHLARQVQIRQRALKHDGHRLVEQAGRPGSGANRAGDIAQFFLAIATDETECRAGRIVGSHEDG